MDTPEMQHPDCLVCGEHSGLQTRVAMMAWIVGGGASSVVMAMLWAVSLLYDIRAGVVAKADATAVTIIANQVAELRARTDALEVMNKWRMDQEKIHR